MSILNSASSIALSNLSFLKGLINRNALKATSNRFYSTELENDQDEAEQKPERKFFKKPEIIDGFEVFDVYMNKKSDTQLKKNLTEYVKKDKDILARSNRMSTDQDWTNAWPTATSFKQSAVPLPLRQGYIKSSCENSGLPPTSYGNAAKHAAALSILNEIRMKSVGQNDNLASKIEYLLQSIKEANLDDRPKEYTDGGASDDSTISSDLTNPVGTLLELTQKYSLRPPAFTFTVEDAEPHNTKFICHTKFGEFTEETGTGRSKKIAKRNAALKLINKLKNSQDFKDLKLEKTNAELTELTSGAKDKNKKSGANVFSMLKSSSKPTIVTLLEKSTNPSDNLTDEALTKETFVQLAKEENLVYNFFNLGKNKAGLHQILLQIKSNPCLVMNGRGITWNEALSDASYNVLSLIKLLCNR